ncbi:MAG: ATPase [Alphaproteobacteria bacterium]|nr:ATPase [Alphaproteobacteria bacterium]
MSETEENGRKDARQLPKRFYKTVRVAERSGGDEVCEWQLLLDARAVRTPGKALVAVPSQRLAEALAEEWRAQVGRIDPATMPLTKIVNSAIDGVRGREAEVAADIVAFAGSDLLCYRAEAPDDLVAMQAVAWDPVIEWARDAFGARFILAQGVMPVEQPQATLDAFAAELRDVDALKLCALHVMTTLTGSALLALAHARGVLSAEAAWDAAHVDEDFQIAQWGADEEAAERREKRWAEFWAARRMWALV